MLFSKGLKILLQSNLLRRTYVDYKNPIKRTLDALKLDIRHGILKKAPETVYPEHADVVIIGAGFLGSSGAYWLKTRAGEGLSVVVLDKNLNKANQTPSGLLSQHYSLPENILLSQFSADFLRNIKEKVTKDVDIKFHPHGYILLASEKYADMLERNVSVLKEFGIKNELLTIEQLKNKYPWINTTDVKLGCISTESEGIFDSQALLESLRFKSLEMGAVYINGEVLGFEMESQRDVLMEGVKPMSFQKIDRVVYKTGNNEIRNIKFAVCVLAAGSDSSNIIKFANAGIDSSLLSLPLPVEKRETNIYSISNVQTKVGLDAPLIMDTSGLWLRRNGLRNNLLSGQIPLKSEGSMSSEESYEQLFKPSLQNRFPHFSNAEINKWGSEDYDYNTFDESGIIGPHPYHTNLIMATGFGKLGVQHCPGLGRAISELIIDCQYTNIDLTRLGFDRILVNEPLIDINIY